VNVESEGVEADLAGIFFPYGEQHVDLISTVEHNVGNSRSETIVKSAATGRGQGRYVGNIRIAQHAQGSEAWLYDHALLLSQKGHIDSVPALEIAANDVKAYHGATVGAIDEEQIFYMTSRGIDRESAEKMIALGFFEPALERFPTHALRERLRSALEGKVRA
jgi:Fe-S cluster assembly protein SufD